MEILIIFTVIVGFYMAWNIGANDVSNAIGTSVGSKALTLKQAVILAAVFEFCGAFFLGSHVSNTIQSGIINPEVFESDPTIYLLGMLGSLIATGIWLNIASFLKMPVSTTHAIVGSIIGFGAIIGGLHAIHWGEVFSIVLSWFITPLLSGSISYILFNILQQRILFSYKPIEATRKFIPYVILIAFTIFPMGLIYNGLSSLHFNLNFPKALLISFIIGIIASIISGFLIRKMTPSSKEKKKYSHPFQLLSLEKATKNLQRTKLSSSGDIHQKTAKLLTELEELRKQVKQETELNYITSDYAKVEKSFVYLQMFSAALIAFAHGANDVANAIGPVAGAMQVINTRTIITSSTIPLWILFLGGAGIIVGLATWGWRVIETIGKKITELTPTRGFSAEFGAAITILLASKFGFPVSTTHALVGSILGVGFARGIRALNLKVLRDITFSWVITIPICAFLSIISYYIMRTIIKF